MPPQALRQTAWRGVSSTGNDNAQIDEGESLSAA
jgi:hypothetical protein